MYVLLNHSADDSAIEIVVMFYTAADEIAAVRRERKMQRFKSSRPRSVFLTSTPPFTTPSTINDPRSPGTLRLHSVDHAGTESLRARRWRKADSNSRSRLTGQCQKRDASPYRMWPRRALARPLQLEEQPAAAL
jgi:hypothetical protein